MNPLKKAIVSAISWYCTYAPIEPGKTRLQRLGLRIIGAPTLKATSRFGQTFELSFPEDFGFDHIFWRKTYETGTLDVLRRIVDSNDTILDIGANMGWYTVHLAMFARHGMVHAFEPMPPTFRRLVHNCDLNNVDVNTKLVNVALGDHQGEAQLHSFANLGHGHSSLSTLGRSDHTAWDVTMMTLDEYLKENGIDRVDVVKMDVEGAEMGVLRGGMLIFSLNPPPIWIVEMNDETAASFGYAPVDLLETIAKQGEYAFFRVVRSWDRVVAMSSVHDYRHGDNAICVPRERMDHWRRAMGAG